MPAACLLYSAVGCAAPGAALALPSEPVLDACLLRIALRLGRAAAFKACGAYRLHAVFCYSAVG